MPYRTVRLDTTGTAADALDRDLCGGYPSIMTTSIGRIELDSGSQLGPRFNFDETTDRTGCCFIEQAAEKLGNSY